MRKRLYRPYRAFRFEGLYPGLRFAYPGLSHDAPLGLKPNRQAHGAPLGLKPTIDDAPLGAETETIT
jgi:hypothetical protein